MNPALIDVIQSVTLLALVIGAWLDRRAWRRELARRDGPR